MSTHANATNASGLLCNVQAGRTLLKQRAPAICQHRSAELLTLHTAPSMSLSHASGTPRASSGHAAGRSAAGSQAPASALHPAGRVGMSGPPATSPSFNPAKPWQQLFRQHSKAGQHVAAALPGGAAERPRFGGAAATARGIGTPPSVEPCARGSGDHALDRTYSVGSLRRGALSFESQRQPSGSACLDQAHSNMSFAADISAELPDPVCTTAAVDGPPPPRSSADRGRRRAMHAAPAAASRRLPMQPSVRGGAQPAGGQQKQSAVGARRPASQQQACRVHQAAEQASTQERPGAAAEATGKSSLAMRCPPPAPLQITSVSPFTEDPDDVLDRFWTSQHQVSPQAPDVISTRSEGPGELTADPAGFGRLYEPGCSGGISGGLPHAGDKHMSRQGRTNSPQPGSSAEPGGSLSLARSAGERACSHDDQAVSKPGSDAEADGAAALHVLTRGNAMLHATDGHAVDARCAARALTSKQAGVTARGKHAAGATTVSKEQADRAAMPAPPRRSRGSKIAGLAGTGKENQPSAPSQHTHTATRGEAAPVAQSKRVAATGMSRPVHDAHFKREPFRSTSNQPHVSGPAPPNRMACSRVASRGVRDLAGGVAGSARPELSANAPLCHRRQAHPHARH